MDYNLLEKHIKNLNKKWAIKVIGHSVLGKKIFAVERFLNKDFSTAILVAGVHARENITCDLVMKFLKDDLFNNVCDFNLAIIPMLNPDGIELCYSGINKLKNKSLRETLLKINNGNEGFSLWKANINGVDLNNNFDAGFGKHISSSVPSSQGFAGEFAESEPESKAITNYIKSKNPFIVIAYHSKGEEIYYNYFQKEKELVRDRLIAEKFASSTGYKIVNVENLSSGGLKDWVVEKLKIPALTIEIGNDELSHPIKYESLEDIYKKHKTIANDLEFAYNITRKYS